MSIKVTNVLFSSSTKSGTDKPISHTKITKKDEISEVPSEFDTMLTTEIKRLNNGGISPYQKYIK